jgi:hypothetical protein
MPNHRHLWAGLALAALVSGAASCRHSRGADTLSGQTCLAEVSFSELVRNAAPLSTEDGWGLTGTQTGTRFEGRMRWTRKDDPTIAIQEAEAANFPELCSALH